MALIADTRFLLTYFFPPNREAAKMFQEFTINAVNKLMIPSIVVTEFIKIAGRRIGYDASKLRIKALESRGSRVIPFSIEDAFIAGRILLKKPNIPFTDACIASMAKRSKCKIVSDDPHFKELKVETIWPI